MKLKEGFIITKNGNDYIAVAAGEAGKAFNGMIKMNGTAGFIATLLAESDTTSTKSSAMWLSKMFLRSSTR